MKKIIAILAILMLVPFTAFGLEALSEDVLDDVTGQAGVSIAVDVNIDMTMDTLAWGDNDGLADAGVTTGGWVGLSNLTMDNLRIRLDNHQGGDLALFTIDVATTGAAGFTQMYDRTTGVWTDSTTARDAGTTFVRLGLGSMLITMDSLKADVQLAATTAEFGTATAGVLGNFAIHNLAIAVDAISYVDISSHTGSGVTLDMAVKINSITMGACAWGDSDGMGDPTVAGGGAITYNAGIGDAYGLAGMPAPYDHTADTLIGAAGDTTGGYVGLRNMTIKNLVITGQVMIDVATIDAGATPGTIAGIYAGIQLQTGDTSGNTAVILRLNNIAIGMDSFEAEIALSNTSDLGNDFGVTPGTDRTNSVMGAVYISNMDVNVDGWVVIGAH